MTDRPDLSAVEEVFKNIPDVSRPPWSEEEVKSLNDFQEAQPLHPFTHSSDDGDDEELLIATSDGWRCPNHPDYDQDWAWPWMVDGSWRIIRSPEP